MVSNRKIEFPKIKHEFVFFSFGFGDFLRNNETEFSDSEIFMVFAPNGTGKTFWVLKEKEIRQISTIYTDRYLRSGINWRK
jgi:hypothetical protein